MEQIGRKRPSLPPRGARKLPTTCRRPSSPSVSEDGSVDERSSTTSSSEDFQQRLHEHSQARTRKDGSVRVAVRVRPMLPKEIARNAGACVYPSETGTSIQLAASGAASKRFTFDHVFPLAATQADLYDEALQPWMDSFLQGFNVTVIAYGQTGSGKTYTMGNGMPSSRIMANQLFSQSPGTHEDVPDALQAATDPRVDTLDDNEGLIPRFLHQLFVKLGESGGSYQLSVSFLEIYGEEIHDLLGGTTSERTAGRPENLQLRESKAGVWVQGLTEVRVNNRQEALEQMRQGSFRRITGSTEMNDRSSRSHAVYTVKIVQRINQQDSKDPRASSTSSTTSSNGAGGSNRRPTTKRGLNSGSRDGEMASDGSEDATVVSKLTFVDLAGSERLKKTHAEGHRMKEGIQINVGLLALGNVINALGDERRRAASQLHVPYRSSKLTRLLQDALGGNSRTLFIACVSPAEANASETLNTLQYANRAKNIQNKAVKNIDSRSAELLSLRAFNHLLRRELIKAIFARSGEADATNVDSLVETTMANPKVLAYLNQMEELASSAGLDASDGEQPPGSRRLLDGLTAQLFDMVPSDGYRRTASSTDMIVADHDDHGVGPASESELMSDSESSVTVMEEKPDEYSAVVSRYPLNQLCRTLDIISLTLEAQEIQNLEARHRKDIESKISNLETRQHRKELVKDGLARAIGEMRTWLDLETSDQAAEKWRLVQKNVERGTEKLELMEIELEELQRQKTVLQNELKEEIKVCRKELKGKHERITRVRESREQAVDGTTASPLDILIRASEIKFRFKLWDLVGISNCLEGEEKEMAAYMDEEVEAIAYMSSLFTKDEMASAASLGIFESIKDLMQVALDNEDLNASMSRELRSRAQLLQSIMNGWMSCHSGDMTEQEFMEENEEKLQSCEESIAQIDAAIRARRRQQGSMSAVFDSITSLELAKSVMKRLVEEMYSQKRIYLAFFEDDDAIVGDEHDAASVESNEDKVSSTEAAMLTKKIQQLTEDYEKDMLCALQMVTSLRDSTQTGDEPLTESQLSLWTEKYAAADQKASLLEESEGALKRELAAKDQEMVAMRAQLEELQASAKSSEMKEESFRLMSRCQEIWKELGLNEEDQASKFQDINELLIKKCSEELEGLEAAREKLQTRINDATRVVKQLEAVLGVANPVDAEELPALAGPTLLEQEKFMLTLQKRLRDELWQRLNARIRSLEGIRELVEGLQIQSVTDFRHVLQDEVGHVDLVALRDPIAQLDLWKEFQQDPKSTLALECILKSFTESSTSSLSRDCIQQEELLFNSLLKEKSKRIAEVEDILTSIRETKREMQFSEDDTIAVLRAMRDASHNADSDTESSDTSRFEGLAAWILEKGGALDVSQEGLEALAEVRQGFDEIRSGRSNALKFLHSTLQDGVSLTQDILAFPDLKNDVQPVNLNLGTMPNQDSHDTADKSYECFQDALVAGKKRLLEMSEPVEKSLRALLYSMNDDFAAFGIETHDQRVSFFLGSDGQEHQVRRAVLERYAVVFTTPSSDEEGDELLSSASESLPGTNDSLPDCHDSLLSELDPAFQEFGAIYSLSFGSQQLQRLREAIKDVSVVKSTVQGAQNRLQSLQKIMKLFNEITDFKKKIGDFEASASKKDRLFGSSLRLLEEERFRKMASKRYPNLLAALRKEVARWLENEEGEYDLSVLGEDLKNLLLDMMNTDTGLMHLDLGVVDSTRATVRRPSKPLMTPAPTSNNSVGATTASNSAPGRVRAQSMSTPVSRDSTRRKRLTLEH